MRVHQQLYRKSGGYVRLCGMMVSLTDIIEIYRVRWEAFRNYWDS